MRKNLGVLFAVVFLMALLAACAAPPASPSPPATADHGTVVPLAPTPEGNMPPAPPLVAGGEDVVIVLQSEGGFAGLSETTVIHDDGKVEITGRDRPQRTLQASAEQVAALVSIFERENFSNLRPSYLPQVTCCDRMIYTITYYQNGKSKSVTTIDANPEEPPALQAVMQALNNFLAGLH